MRKPGKHLRSRVDIPVFVDHSGRRRRFVVALGAACGVLLLLAAVVLVLGLTGAGPANKIPGWPEGAPGRTGPTPGTAPQHAPTPTDKPVKASGRPAASATPDAAPSDASHGNGNGKASHAPTTHPSKGH